MTLPTWRDYLELPALQRFVEHVSGQGGSVVGNCDLLHDYRAQSNEAAAGSDSWGLTPLGAPYAWTPLENVTVRLLRMNSARCDFCAYQINALAA